MSGYIDLTKRASEPSAPAAGYVRLWSPTAGGLRVLGESSTYDDVGTWTPEFIGTGGSGTPAYTSRSGMWARNGPVVTAWFDLVLSSKSTASGNVQLDGLPFTALANSWNWAGSISGVSGLNNAIASMQCRAIQASTRIQLLRILADGGTANAPLAVSNVLDTFAVNGQVTYRIA